MLRLESGPDFQTGIDLGGQFNVVRHDAASPDHVVTIPSPDLMFSGDYKRAGTDLVLSSPDGEHLTVHDYFRGDKRPALSAPNGATLSGDIVEALTGHGPYAQAASTPADAPQTIGRVASVQGNATAIRNGVAVALNAGDAVYKGDVVQTASTSAVGVIFTDGSTFNLSASARMVLNEFIYDPNGTSNAATISLVQGAISFLAGQVAKTGDMKVATPVATMGIRGTAVNVNISADNGATNISVMAEADNITHTVQVFALPTQADIAAGKTVGALLGTVTSNSGVFTFNPTPTGVLVQEIAKDVATIQHEMAILQQVFQTQFIGQQFLQGPDVSDTKTAQGPTGTQFIVSDSSTTHHATPTNNNVVDPTVIKVVIGTEDTGGSKQNGPVHQNTAPVAHSDTDGVVAAGIKPGNVAFAGTPVVHGNVLDNDTDVDPADTKTVSSVSPASAHLHGTLSLGADGNYTYTLDNSSPLTQQLAAGETAQDIFNYTIKDSDGATSTSTLTITITGTDDAPVIAVADKAQTDAITEHDLTTASTTPDVRTGTIHFTDLDLSDRPTATISSQALTYRAADGHLLTLTIDEADALKKAFKIAAEANTNDGTIDWKYNIQDGKLDFLAKGEKVTLISTVLVDDGHGGTDTATVTVTLTGIDDKPIISPLDKIQSDTVAELSNTTGALTIDHAAGGVIHFSDVDLTDRPTAMIDSQNAVYKSADGMTSLALSAAQVGVIMAAFTIAPAAANANNGATNWAYNIADSSLDFLAAGETVTLTSVVLLDDHNGGTDTSTVTVTITGTNDAPVVSGAVADASVIEDGSPSALNALTHASDVDHGTTLSVVNVPATLGVSYDAVSHTFTLDSSNAAYQHLADGQTTTVTVNYGVSDGIATTPGSVSWTITGTNDAPVAVDDAGAVTAGGGPITGNVLTNDTDADDNHVLTVTNIVGGANAFQTITADGIYGEIIVTKSTGAYTYTLGADASQQHAVAALPAGQQAEEDFVYTVGDGLGGMADAHLKITVTGIDDAPVTSAVTLTAIDEDSGARLITQAELLANASDVDSASLTATGLAVTSGNGTLADNHDGTWSYTSASNDDTSVAFSYQVTDGKLSADGSATLDLTPVNDAPVANDFTLGNDQIVFSEDTDTAIDSSVLLANVSDVDSNNVVVTSVGDPNSHSAHDGTVTLNNGIVSYTPAANFNGADSFTYTVSDGALTSTATVKVSVAAVQDTFVFAQGGGHDTVVGFDTTSAHADYLDASAFVANTPEAIQAFLDSADNTTLGLLFTQVDDSILLKDVHSLMADHVIGATQAA
ncbi:MAG: tandem-95 repeat protein [Pseudolabrys sp.]